MIAFKSAAVILLTLVIELLIQERLPHYSSDPLISSVAQVVLRSGLGVAFAISWGRYLGMWRRVSGASMPWRIAGTWLVPVVIIAILLSSEAELLLKSPWIQVACLTMWGVLAWSGADVGGALDAHYAARTSSVAALDRIVAGLPERISRRGDLVGLDVAQIALSALAWYAMHAGFGLG